MRHQDRAPTWWMPGTCNATSGLNESLGADAWRILGSITPSYPCLLRILSNWAFAQHAQSLRALRVCISVFLASSAHSCFAFLRQYDQHKLSQTWKIIPNLPFYVLPMKKNWSTSLNNHPLEPPEPQNLEETKKIQDSGPHMHTMHPSLALNANLSLAVSSKSSLKFNNELARERPRHLKNTSGSIGANLLKNPRSNWQCVGTWCRQTSLSWCLPHVLQLRKIEWKQWKQSRSCAFWKGPLPCFALLASRQSFSASLLGPQKNVHKVQTLNCTNLQSWYALLCLPNTKLRLTCSRAAISDCFNIISCTDCSIRRSCSGTVTITVCLAQVPLKKDLCLLQETLDNWHFSSLSHILFLSKTWQQDPPPTILRSFSFSSRSWRMSLSCISVWAARPSKCMRQRTRYEAAWGFSLIVAEFLILFAPK